MKFPKRPPVPEFPSDPVDLYDAAMPAGLVDIPKHEGGRPEERTRATERRKIGQRTVMEVAGFKFLKVMGWGGMGVACLFELDPMRGTEADEEGKGGEAEGGL
jgi:hypothetical protein